MTAEAGSREVAMVVIVVMRRTLDIVNSGVRVVVLLAVISAGSNLSLQFIFETWKNDILYCIGW